MPLLDLPMLITNGKCYVKQFNKHNFHQLSSNAAQLILPKAEIKKKITTVISLKIINTYIILVE